MGIETVSTLGLQQWRDLFSKAGIIGEMLLFLGAIALFIAIYKVLEFFFIGILPFHRAKQKPLVYFEGYHGIAALEARGAEYVSYLERGLVFLNIITAVAPLLGLLGTVMGMIEAFQTMASLGDVVNISNLAGGIWKALLTTALGLSIAIPTMIFMMILQKVIDKHITYINTLLFSEQIEKI